MRTALLALTIDAPRPPRCTLARLIQSSIASRSTEPPDSVRAAMASHTVRRLLRLRTLAKAAAPHMLNALDNQLRRASLKASTGRP